MIAASTMRQPNSGQRKARAIASAAANVIVVIRISPPLQQHRHDHGLACCCDCLGCSSAVCLAPALGITPADLTARAHYDAVTTSLSGRALRPDPDPPRPGALI